MTVRLPEPLVEISLISFVEQSESAVSVAEIRMLVPMVAVDAELEVEMLDTVQAKTALAKKPNSRTNKITFLGFPVSILQLIAIYTPLLVHR